MRPDQYEQIVANYFKQQGYKTELSQNSHDYGVDVFAVKGKNKIAIQAKMYGNTSRRINRQIVFELHGAKDYFDCTKAVIATDGELIDNAQIVADKLNIEVIKIPATDSPLINDSTNGEFETIWEEYVMPLAGRTIKRTNGETNHIISVDWSGVKRITSNNKEQTIKIEIFKKTILHILEHGFITRKQINDEYLGRASSGIVLILGNTDKFEITSKPTGLKVKRG